MLEHLVAFCGLVLNKKLIDNDRRVSVFAKPGDTLLQVFRPMGFVASSIFQSDRTLLAACRWGYEEDHAFCIARGAP
jgi:hypothetical protein